MLSLFPCLQTISDEETSQHAARLTTAEFSYMLSVTRVTWFQARELCLVYGDGFYLADVNGTEELGFLRNWLKSLSLDKASFGE